MALNEIYKDANELVFPVNTAIVKGDFVKVGDIVGVAQNTAVTGEDGNKYATLKLNGAFEIAFKSGDTFDVGQKADCRSPGISNQRKASRTRNQGYCLYRYCASGTELRIGRNERNYSTSG